MVEGYWRELGRSLWIWSGWIFTVLGAVAGIAIAREYWWILALIIVTFGLALGTFSYRTYRKWEEAEKRHQAEMNAGRAREQTAVERLREAERKLNEVPSAILLKLQEVIHTYSLRELARRSVAHAEFVGRMRDFANTSSKPITPKAFTTHAGDLYVVAKAEMAALTHLRVGDPFLLVRKTASGLETTSARLVVHQPPDPRKETVFFRIADFLGDEMSHIDSLAQSGDVEGIKGYRVQAACDLASYASLDMRNLAAAVERLMQEIEPFRGGAQ